MQWMVLEARRLADSTSVETQKQPSSDSSSAPLLPSVRETLNRFDYDQAARIVYGMNYSDWKKEHQSKATEEQLERYEASRPFWAHHDESMLKPRPTSTAFSVLPTFPASEPPSNSNSRNDEKAVASSKSLASNVCCETVSLNETSKVLSDGPVSSHSSARTGALFVPPPILFAPAKASEILVGILVVSDRAFHQQYASGDLSGPAVQAAVGELLEPAGYRVDARAAIVLDETTAIQTQIVAWCKDSGDQEEKLRPRLILTTGGTGMSPRDVTPEATRAILDQECCGLMPFVMGECSRTQPLASLSRGTAGICHHAFIANLPGNPRAAKEVLTILLPLIMNGYMRRQDDE
jgi:molybdopterin adenylyltransferase